MTAMTLTREERRQAAEAVYGRLEAAGVEAFLILEPENQRYLEGYEGADCYLLVSPRGHFLFADPRYTLQASQECLFAEVVPWRDPFPPLGEAVGAVLRRLGCRRVGFERHRTLWSTLEEVRSGSPGVEWIPLGPTVEPSRRVKTPGEVEALREACRISDEGLRATLERVAPGMREIDFARELEYRMARAGAEDKAFDTIAAFGERGAMAHAIPSDRELREGDLILVDFGARVRGYRADITRTFVLGTATERQRELYAAVRDAQAAAIAALRPGIPGREPNRACMRVLEERGCLDRALKSLGHGVGLEIHEDPNMRPDCEMILEENMVVTVEPSVSLPDWGGIRIEDTVRIAREGAEVLTRFPKDRLIELPLRAEARGSGR
jgi:Xaa-Pro aminopeptidase